MSMQWTAAAPPLIAAATLLLLALPASAAPPHDVLGFYPGQKASDGFALAGKVGAKPCDGVKNCIAFNTTYLGYRSRISVEIGDKTGVTRVAFNISNDGQPKVPDCAAMSGAIVAAAAKAYGRFDESDPGATYTWRDAKLKYKMIAICIPSKAHPPVGGIVGMFQSVDGVR